MVEQFESYVKLNKKVPPEAAAAIPQITDPSQLADTIAAHLAVKIADRQQLLETFHVGKRLERVFALMEGEISVLQVEKKIRGRVKRQMEKTQREYYLNEQMKAIQRELGEQDDARDELIELEKRIKKTKLSKEARTKAQAELKKLRNMSPMSAEAPSCATTSTGCCRSRGASRRPSRSTSSRPSTSSRRTTTAWRRSRSASSNTSRCRRAPAP